MMHDSDMNTGLPIAAAVPQCRVADIDFIANTFLSFGNGLILKM